MRFIGVLLAVMSASLFMSACEEEEEDREEPFRVLWSVPADGETMVPPKSLVLLRFSRPPDLECARLQIRLARIVGWWGTESVQCTFQVEGDILTLTPVSPLEEDTEYGVGLYPGVKSTDGEFIVQPYTLVFSTGPVVRSIPNQPWTPLGYAFGSGE